MPTRRLRLWVATIIVSLVALLGVADAQKVKVKGYVKKDGTVVQPYERNKPGTKSTQPATPLPKAPPATDSSVVRADDGSIKRSEAARLQFMTETGYPNGRPGYVVDHVVPLACGGPDSPANMQWQTVDAAKEKDKVERKDCAADQGAIPVTTVPSFGSDMPAKPAAAPTTSAGRTSPAAAPAKTKSAPSGRCQAITKKGTQCSRNAQPGSAYCWQHQR